MGIFSTLAKLFKGKDKRNQEYSAKQSEQANEVIKEQPKNKLGYGNEQKIKEFRNKVAKRRLHNLMRLNTLRKERNLFQYAI